MNFLNQVKQLATEKLGTADPECITEMPVEYTQLEQKLEKFKSLYESMLKLTRNFTTSDYDPTVAESVKDVMGKLNELVVKPTQQLAGRHSNGNAAGGAADATPRTFAHALARSSSEHALNLGEHEPLGVALKKFSAAQDILGNAKLKLEKDVVDDFVQPWRATLEFNIQNAAKSRKNVQSLRLKLDASKTALKNSKPEQMDRLQAEYQKAEEEFLNAVADTSHKMRLVVDSPEPLRNLANLVKAQLEYFKTAFESLQSLHPELDELQVTQQALFRSN